MKERFRLLPGGPLIGEAQILAYVDGQLPPRERAEVESALATDPKAAEEVEAYQTQNRLLHSSFSARHLPPPPPNIEALTQAIADTRASKPRRHGPLQAAGFLLAMLLGGLVFQVWEEHDELQDIAFFQEEPSLSLLGAFKDWNEGPAQPLHLRSQDLPSIAPSSAVNAIPDSRGRAPDLRSEGLELIAARLLPGRQAGAMELIYETPERARVSLYFGPARERGNPRFSLLQEGAMTLLFWHQQGRSFGLVSELGRDKLLAVGSAVQAAWRHQPAPATGLDGTANSPDSLL